jgi:hypothetical protein
MNRTTVFLGTLAIAVAGLFLPVPFGPALLLALLIGAALLLARTWPVTPPPLRAARLAILALLLALALARLLLT